ncbi:MAG: purine-nucleoside phosphorylase [Solirubrobacterales bacterium]
MAPLQDIDLPEGDGETLHLNPAAAFHPNVLLPGDPARAMAIATKQLNEPRMFNHRRGLWGYSGETAAGTGFLVQSTGMGGPSAAIVCEELADLGAEIFLRVGTCAAIDPQVKLGDLFVVVEAISDDGASAALGAPDRTPADAELTELLLEQLATAGHPWKAGYNATVDLFYDPAADARQAGLVAKDALTLEMEAATVFAVGARRGVRSACLLAVTDALYEDTDRDRLTHDQITELGELLGVVGVGAIEALRER